MYDVGDSRVFTYTVTTDTDPTGLDVAGTLTLTRPDGTTVTPAVGDPITTGSGPWTLEFTAASVVLPDAPGDWLGLWETTGIETTETFQFLVVRPSLLLATVAEFEARLRRVLTDAERVAVLADLADASALVRQVAVVPEPVPQWVRAIVLGAARRAFDNPEGFTAETIGDYSYRRSAGGSGVYLTEDEERRLRAQAGGGLPRSVALGLYNTGAP